jgi:hypothetical protein
MRRRLALAFVIVLPGLAAAQDTVDAQFWMQTLATIRLSENWRLHLEEWPRFSDDEGGAFQIITRTALGRRVGQRATLWGGYAWVAKPPGPGVTHEHRIWQQLSAVFPDRARWVPSIRVRLEQRFQDGWADASHRLRTMGRFVRPVAADRRWSLAAWDELMVTLDGTEGGPSQGYDQNRLFGGLLRQFSPAVGLEFGYMWQTTNPPASPATHAHVAFVWLNLTP